MDAVELFLSIIVNSDDLSLQSHKHTHKHTNTPQSAPFPVKNTAAGTGFAVVDSTADAALAADVVEEAMELVRMLG